MNVILIETSGNQRYIFATNKLRENVGASELTYRVGTETVLKAIDKEKCVENDHEKKLWEANGLDGCKLRANLLNKTKNPELVAGGKIEILTATSGKALLLVESTDIGKSIIKKVVKDALRNMPGLTVHGAISKPFGNLASNDFSDVHEAIGEVHRKLEEIRYQIPSNEQRFLRLPFVAPCKTSGLPASAVQFFSANEDYLLSSVTLAKWNSNKKEGKKTGKRLSRIESVIKKASPEIVLPENLEKLEKIFDADWLAVIHADGNGLGQIFLDFNEYAGFDETGKWTGRQYLEDYRKFSLALDVCTINAASDALESLRKSFQEEQRQKFIRQGKDPNNIPKEIPVVPIVLGGDDLTIFCDGQYALSFTHDFLANFEKEARILSGKDYLTNDDETATINGKTIYEILKDIVPKIANKAFEKNYLGICAGVAIVKPHFPFHQAYELAEQLLRSAKQVKEKVHQELQRGGESIKEQIPCSALDFHVLYDSAHSDLDDIRKRLTVDGDKTKLFAKPYVVTDEKELSKAIEKTWLENRMFVELETRVNAMTATDKDGKRKLPSSQLHSLREALFLGKNEATARVNLIAHRYENEQTGKKFGKLFVKGIKSLFFTEAQTDGEVHSTHFMDALDMIEFWKGFPESTQRNEEEKGANE